MKDLVYFFVATIFILAIYQGLTIDDWKADMSRIEDYEGYIVVNKTNNWLTPNRVEIMKDSLRHNFHCDDIIYQRLQVGDTLSTK